MTTAVSVAGAIDTLNDQTQPSTATRTPATARDMSNGTKTSAHRDNTSPKEQAPAPSDSSTNRILLNPLLSEFIDCIENLPGRLQLLLSELRNVDAEVYRKLLLIKS